MDKDMFVHFTGSALGDALDRAGSAAPGIA